MNLSTTIAVFLFAGLCQALTRRPRATDGDEIESRLFPYIAALINVPSDGERSAYCSGGIINQRWILTVARCIYDGIEHNYTSKILVGTTKITQGGVLHEISKTIPHKRYVKGAKDTYIWDIALIKTQKNIIFNDFVNPFKLPEKQLEKKLKHSYFLAGWGMRQFFDDEGFTGQTANDLHVIPLYPFDQNRCQKDLDSESQMVFCVVNVKRKDGPCKGDSGGPLEYDGTVYGIHSFGSGDCKDEDDFISVNFFNPWIRVNILRNPS